MAYSAPENLFRIKIPLLFDILKFQVEIRPFYGSLRKKIHPYDFAHADWLIKGVS
jgi:hypothetical protein